MAPGKTFSATTEMARINSSSKINTHADSFPPHSKTLNNLSSGSGNCPSPVSKITRRSGRCSQLIHPKFSSIKNYINNFAGHFMFSMPSPTYTQAGFMTARQRHAT